MRASETLASQMIESGLVETVARQAGRLRDHEAIHGDPFNQHLGPALAQLTRKSDWRGLPRQTKRDAALIAIDSRTRRSAQLEEFQRSGVQPTGGRERSQAADEQVDVDEYELDDDGDPTLDDREFQSVERLVAAAPSADSEAIGEWLIAIDEGELQATPRQRQQLEQAWAEAHQDDQELAEWVADQEEGE